MPLSVIFVTELQTTKHGHGRSGFILLGAGMLLLVALFAVPGYVAGFYCRIAHDRHGVSPRPFPMRILFAPARLAIQIAPRMENLYYAQFDEATDPDKTDVWTNFRHLFLPPDDD